MLQRSIPTVAVAALTILTLGICGALIASFVTDKEPALLRDGVRVDHRWAKRDGEPAADPQRQEAPDTVSVRPEIPVSPVALDGGGEDALMDQLHRLRFTQPSVSLALAQEGNRLYPDSPAAAERDWYAVRCLVELGRFDEAIDASRRLVERHPGSTFASDVTRHLLSHPMN